MKGRENLFCPILILATQILGAKKKMEKDEVEKSAQCLGEKCAWWYGDRCIFVGLVIEKNR